MTASNVSRFENVWRWFLDVEPSERKHTPRNKIAQIHLDGGDDYLDCDLLICCTTVWLDATDARVSPLRRGARHVPLWWVEAYWQDDRPSCDDGSDTIDNPGSINPWFDSYADTAAYVESTRREWICLLNCALQNTGNLFGAIVSWAWKRAHYGLLKKGWIAEDYDEDSREWTTRPGAERLAAALTRYGEYRMLPCFGWVIFIVRDHKPNDKEKADGGTVLMLYRLDDKGDPGTLYQGSRATLVWSPDGHRVTGALWRGRTYSTAQGLADAWLAYADSEKGAEY